jgi:hypothetical protein
MFAGAAKDKNSFSLQCIGALPRLVDSKPDTRYVKGFTRYMKIQKPGRASGLARIPQNAYIMIDNMLETLEAISALSTPAISICANELANRNVTQIRRKTRVLRECSVLLYSALRKRPTG